MTDEFDERLSHSPSRLGMRCQYVGDGIERKQEPDPADVHALEKDVLAPEPRKALVPYGSQELLDVGVGAELWKENKDNPTLPKYENPVVYFNISIILSA